MINKNKALIKKIQNTLIKMKIFRWKYSSADCKDQVKHVTFNLWSNMAASAPAITLGSRQQDREK